MPIRKDKNVQVTVVMSQDMYKSVKMVAASKHINMSDVIRSFIQKGLCVESYQDNIDFLSAIIRQEVKAEIGKQANRLASMFFKVGIIASGNYFMCARLMSDVISPSMQDDFKDINSNARRLGIDYMKMNGVGAVEFLEDDEGVGEAMQKLKMDLNDLW